MAYGRFVKKVMRKGKRYAKKRYMRKGAGYGTGVRLNKLSKDMASGYYKDDMGMC